MGAAGEFGLEARQRSPMLLQLVGAGTVIATCVALGAARAIAAWVVLGAYLERINGALFAARPRLGSQTLPARRSALTWRPATAAVLAVMAGATWYAVAYRPQPVAVGPCNTPVCELDAPSPAALTFRTTLPGD